MKLKTPLRKTFQEVLNFIPLILHQSLVKDLLISSNQVFLAEKMTTRLHVNKQNVFCIANCIAKMQKTSKKNKQINIRTSQEVYDVLEFEAKKRGTTITDLCCQGVEFLIANLHSKRINEALKKTYSNEVSETLQGIQASLSLSLDFEMSKLQELENRVSNVERALVRLFGVISDQSQSILTNDNQEQSSDRDAENSKAASKTDENSADSIEQNTDTINESKNNGFRKSKHGGEVEASAQNATSVKRETPKTDKSERLTHCPHCHSSKISKNGHDRYGQQMYRCKNCRKNTTLNQKTLGWI